MGGFVLILVLALVPILLVSLIILLVSRKSTEPFTHKIETMYNYIILLASIVLAIIGGISLVTSLTDVFLPTTPTIDYNQYYVDIISAVGTIIVSAIVFFLHRKNVQKKNK